MKTKMNRRDFGKLAAGATLASTLASVGAFAQAAEVRLIWWGNPERDKRTNAVIDLYMKEMGTAVVPETYAWGDYWQKLATQAAGRNLPDVIQMDYRYIFEYARRQQLAALDSFIGNELELGDYDQNQLDSGKVDGKVYGVSMGANSMSHVYNKTVLDGIGVTLPDSSKWTIDDWVAIGKDIKGKLPDGMYFVSNFGGQENMLETWMRQRGKALYTEDGKLAFDVDDMTAYWEHWYKMLESGLTPPADVQAQDAGKMEEMMLLTKHSAFDFLHSNQLVAAQKLSPDELAMTMIPNQAGGKPGQYMKPSMLLSMAETSPDKEGAAKLMAFFVTDPDANNVLLIERGVTGDASVRKNIMAKLTPTENKIIDYLNIVSTWVGPLPPPPPKGAGEIDRAIEPAWQAVAFKQKKLDAAAKEFYEFCKTTLERA
jgi:pectin-derived oligosaccharide transport system substrate-binding protein